MRFDDDQAQWLLLSGVIISIGLVALLLLLNNAVLTGHSSSQSITSFPKNELRDLRSNSISEITVLGEAINKDNSITSKEQAVIAFNTGFERYYHEAYNMSLIHGGLINIVAIPAIDTSSGGNLIISNVSLSINYYDDTTTYSENVLVGVAG
jgi:hypothetical protein